jgi:hypothetical protein
MVITSKSRYLGASTAASGDYKHVSAVPERFRSTSNPVPGQSAVPAEFRGTSNPDIAKTRFTKAMPVDARRSPEQDSRDQQAASEGDS